MGQGSPAVANHHLSLRQLQDRYIVESQLPDSNCRLLRLRETGQWFMLKEMTLTSNEELADISGKLRDRQLLRHDHYLPLASYFVRSQSSFCSTFHKVNALYEYGRHSLRNEVQARLQQGKQFCEKQIWSILCSCCIVMAYLEKNNVEYRLVSPEDVFLTDEGVVKIVDPQLAAVGRTSNARPYYAPQLLTSHRDSPNAAVFSLGMTILELVFLEPLFDCYDYEGFGFNDSLFNVRVKELEKIPLSDNLKQVLMKMLTSSDRQRPGIIQLEEMLYQVVESTFGESMVSAEDIVNNRQSNNRLVSTAGVEPQSTFRNVEEDIDGVTAQPDGLPALTPEDDEPVLSAPDKILVDLQLPDEAEDKNEAVLTDRSNVLATSNSNRYLKKQTPLMDNQPTFNKEQLQAVIRFDKKENCSPIQAAELEKEPTFGQRTEKETRSVDPNQSLFTDPKLLELVKRDLQDISMRKSMCSMTSNSQQQSRNVLTTNNNPFAGHPEYRESMRGSVVYNLPPVQTMHSENNQSIRYSLPAGATMVTTSDDQNFVVENYNKGRYEGQKKNGVRHGFGTFYYKEGGKYTGQWKDNRMDGKGTLYYYNQRVAYEGEWKEDRLWGSGTLYNEQPKALHQSFDYTNFFELDEYWLRYEGGFYDDNKKGFGRYYLSNGQQFEGQFDNDELNGEGIFYTRDGRIVRGLWQKNLLIKQY